jgi:phosphoglycolate phosphatase-like HAD superfamily hydrolase
LTQSEWIEVVRPETPRGGFRFALFDFDGTLSLIREGWLGVMIPYFVEELADAPDAEDRESLEAVVREFVERLTGKQTIYQCFQLQEEIRRRGGEPREALDYKHEYLRRLDERIAYRVSGLRDGGIAPDDLTVRGSREFLRALTKRGVACFLASGTDLPYVQAEVKALTLDEFFGEHVYAALDRYQDFSKQMVIEKILRENGLQGPELLVVGDGYVEIENGKAAGGFALGVASDEANPGGLDEWKRRRLIQAGADTIIPDYEPVEELLTFLFP